MMTKPPQDYLEDARRALDDARVAIEEVGSLRQDEFRFWHHLVAALTYALLAMASRGGAID